MDKIKEMEEKAVWLKDEELTEETVVTVEKKPDEIKVSWKTKEK